jgi:3-phosphoshikimate 1-carboxyvinyltransferase
MSSFKVNSSAPLLGDARLPGDKSISHRSIMISSLSHGDVSVSNFLASEDCLRTVECMRSMGVKIDKDGTDLKISGKGLFSLKQPGDILYVGNSGTTIRLLLGILAGQSFKATITGDKSILKRPMDRVAAPLKMMGAKIEGSDSGKYAPLTISGGSLKAIEYSLPVASAQVKSAVLLAGLYASGRTVVVEKTPTRDHTERMLEHFGAKIERSGQKISIAGGSPLGADSISIPSDISSAAFVMVAASLIPGSDVIIRSVGVNPGRTGIIDVLHRMGANIEVSSERIVSGEPVADIRIRHSRLKGIEISGSEIPRVIDEIPIIALAAALAEGNTVIRDAAELRVKESDRIRTTASELKKFGAEVVEKKDGMMIKGGAKLKGADCESSGDHRIAMMCVVAGLVAGGCTKIDNVECVETSFPGFATLFNGLLKKTCIESR